MYRVAHREVRVKVRVTFNDPLVENSWAPLIYVRMQLILTHSVADISYESENGKFLCKKKKKKMYMHAVLWVCNRFRSEY